MSFHHVDNIQISLPRHQWDNVLTMLAHRPFNEVAGLFGEIQRQCQMHDMRQRATQTPRLVPEDYAPIEQPAE